MFLDRIRDYSEMVRLCLNLLDKLQSPVSPATNYLLFRRLDELKRLEEQLIREVTPEQVQQIPEFGEWLRVRQDPIQPACETKAGRKRMRAHIASAGALADVGNRLLSI